MKQAKAFLKAIYGMIPWKRYIFSIWRFLGIPGDGLIKHLHFKGPFTIKLDGKRLSLIHYGYQIENGVFWKGLPAGWEPVSMSLWLECSRRSKVILDVGANTGIYALAAKTTSPTAQVWAFEPVERVFHKLEKNSSLNSFDLTCVRVALSNKTGMASIFDPGSEHIYSVTVNKDLGDPSSTTKEVKIPTERLDEYWGRHGRGQKIDLMKIDVETHEKEVLEGMGNLISIYKPAMLIELLNDEIALGVEEILAPFDYLFFNIDEKNRPILVSRLVKSSYHNFFVCQKALAQELNLIHASQASSLSAVT